MSALSLHTPLPLLSKELVEQAAQLRTYLIRIAYAVLLFAVFCVFTYGYFERTEYGLAQIGRGRAMFETLVYLQFAGILLFLPALMSSAVAAEKERQSLGLLLLTELRPTEILLQKYLGRLVPMFTFLLLGTPLLAVCYALGGLTPQYLAAGVAALFLTCLQVGALSLLCSSYCRTSLGAFVASYIAAGLSCLILAFARLAGGASAFPLATFTAASGGEYHTAVGHGFYALIAAAAFLAMARSYLVKRALVQPKAELVRFFKAVDGLSEALGFGTVQVIRPRSRLPDDEPIAWRERMRSAIGKPRYLFRIVALLEAPVLLIAFAGLTFREPEGTVRVLSGWLAIVWVFAALLIAVSSANVVAAERTRQTLDVLLTAPLDGRAILRQKLAGVRRLFLVLLIPFLTIFLLEALWRYEMEGEPRGGPLAVALYLLASVLSVAVHLPLVSWLALWIGLRARTRSRAILTVLIILAVWNGGPWLLYALVSAVAPGTGLEMFVATLAFFSPATVVIAAEIGALGGEFMGWVVALTAVNLVAYGLALWGLRAACLAHADRYLGRAEVRRGPGDEAWPIAATPAALGSAKLTRE